MAYFLIDVNSGFLLVFEGGLGSNLYRSGLLNFDGCFYLWVIVI